MVDGAASHLDDHGLWTAFRACTLPHRDWTHRSHVRVAFLHLRRWPLDEAHLRLRAGIIRLNERHGLEETPERGYFETLTRAWLVVVAHAAADRAYLDSEVLLAAHPELLDKNMTFRFYSRELLASARARAVFVEPDLAPLPWVERG